MNSKDKGNIGEAIMLAEFIKRGIQVSIPFGDNARYDLIIDLNGKLYKVQVKYCNERISVNNSVACPCSSSYNHTTNKVKKRYIDDIDFICFYLAEWNEKLILPIEKIANQLTITFRKDKPQNALRNVNYVSDYRLSDFLDNYNNCG